MDKYLPIGSVVLLKEGKKRLMIYGVKQMDSEKQTEYDYVGCLFPEGNIDDEHIYVFNHNQIDKIFYIGLQDEEQYKFNEYLVKSTNQ
ncbi:MAG: DUF4176 domain-containing protein [Clostridium sp.]|nr:DUF4176 domain-containing protein [Clostridium sp.]